ncbi:MAG: cysteine desulfurase [Clostridiales bacterium]|nr:cysteine desulfurase [Clostridiales bacterium]
MIYLDNAATTVLDGDVLAAMLPYLQSNYGNSQSQHAAGRAAAQGLISARDRVAAVFGCKAEEVYFLSGGTEAGNLAVKGVCSAHGKGHLIISAIEHPAVIESAKQMQNQGFEVTFIKPDSRGIIPPEEVEKAVRPDTVFCAVMAANNEIGTIQNVQKIGEICTRHGIFYYCDCVQSVGVVPFPVGVANAFAVSAHKFHGPKGVAAMYIKSGSKIQGIISGGRQERGLRGGTVNVASAVGLATALEKAVNGENNAKIASLRNTFVKRVLTEIEGTHLNGDPVERVPSNANISFDGCEGENVLFCLDLKGICVSTGSACSAGAVTPSHVIAATAGETYAKSAVRFTFGKYNTAEDVDLTVTALKEIISKIRK